MQTQKRFQCRHIFTDGHRCGSPVLLLETPNPAQPAQTHEDFCYYHHTTRRPAPRTLALANPGADPAQTAFDLPLPEDRSAIQAAIGSILRHIAGNTLDARRAGLLLYGLQIAALNLPPRDRYHDRDEEIPEPVTAIVTHPTHGPIAESSEIIPPPERKSLGRQLMEEFGPSPDDPHPDPLWYPDFYAPTASSQNQPSAQASPQQEDVAPSVLPNLQAVAASNPCPTPRTKTPKQTTKQKTTQKRTTALDRTRPRRQLSSVRAHSHATVAGLHPIVASLPLLRKTWRLMEVYGHSYSAARLYSNLGGSVTLGNRVN
ncbi:MAG TPA: hypothetical protein VH250_06360 [Granulicella sp.]|jgi:hypothetical protein|nr:hypothetical protein [Granulicella sp.]